VDYRVLDDYGLSARFAPTSILSALDVSVAIGNWWELQQRRRLLRVLRLLLLVTLIVIFWLPCAIWPFVGG